MRIEKIIPAVATLALAMGFQGHALAAGRSTTAVAERQVQPPNNLAVPKHTVLLTYANAGIGDAVPALTFTDVDSYKVSCKKPTCMLEISAMMQATFSDDATKPWAIPVWVDGNSVDGGPLCRDPLVIRSDGQLAGQGCRHPRQPHRALSDLRAGQLFHGSLGGYRDRHDALTPGLRSRGAAASRGASAHK